MSFEKGQQRFEELLRRRESGEIDEARFRAEVDTIRVQDEQGFTWRIEPERGWVYWNGATWAVRDHGRPGQQGHDARSQVSDRDRTDVQSFVRQNWRWLRMAIAALQGRLPPPQVFLRQARKVPLRKRSQAWWDALAIMGGAVSGLLWFLYTSVRGMPHLSFLGLSYQSYFDFLPPAALAALAVIVFMMRRKIAALLRPLLAPLRRIPVIGRFGLGAVLLLAGAAIRYRTNLFQNREGLDLLTPMIMFLLPVVIVLFRKPIDMLLLPFDPIRRKIPRLILIILGLAVPYLVAHILYHWFNMIQYPFLRASVMIGTMLSYAIIRTPQRPQPAVPAAARTGGAGPQRPPDAHMLARRRWATVGLAWIFGTTLLWVTPVFADDFFRDPFNANDGLRTPGVASAMAGTATVVVVALVNGAEVVRTVIQGAVSEEDEGKRKNFEIRINTVGGGGEQSTRLEPGICDQIYIYAQCFEIGKGAFPAGDASLTFSQSGAESHVTLNDLGQAHGQRCASVTLIVPAPEDVAPPASFTVNVSAGAGGSLMTIPVVLELELPRYVVRFR